LSNWSIAAGALVVLAVAAVVSFVLLRRYGGQEAQIQLDAIRTAGTLVVGTGGAVALLLTARRQRYTELTLVHTTSDATERRITELYTKAADQLGSEQAPVRLAGLYALERLAHSTVEHRQTIVDVICAYLRMPYTPPQPSASVPGWSYRSPGPARRRRIIRPLSDRSPHATPTFQQARHEHAEQQRQVRLTAQNILSRNLYLVDQHRRHWWHRTPPPAPAWPGIRLNLTGALLLEFSLAGCQLDYASFQKAQFTGRALFTGAQFLGGVLFTGAQFTGGADFWGAQFTGRAEFEDAQFPGGADFTGAQFPGGAFFRDAQFPNRAFFEGAQFTGGAFFGGVQFLGGVLFTGAQFPGGADFEGARVASVAEPGSVWPPGWTTRPANPDNGEDPACLYLTRIEEPRSGD
jgi:uncharacterized protein YjbI with pentapeptide repeats